MRRDSAAAVGSLATRGKDTMASRLVGQLREAIVSGALAAGAKINLDRTRRDLGVSLSPLREALARLTAEGLVRFEDNRGYRVAPVSLADFEEVVALRDRFEVHALRESMRGGDLAWEGDVMRALHVLGRTHRDAGRPESLAAWEAAHRAFHLALVAGCGKPVLLGFCATLLTLSDRYRRTFLRQTSGDRDVAAEHEAIARAAVAREPEATERLRDHLARTSRNLRAHLVEDGTA